jgi:hypothetical protein
MDVSAPGCPESVRDEKFSSAREKKKVLAHLGKVSSWASQGAAACCFLLCSGAAPCGIPEASATNANRPSASKVAAPCSACRKWSSAPPKSSRCCWCRGGVCIARNAWGMEREPLELCRVPNFAGLCRDYLNGSQWSQWYPLDVIEISHWYLYFFGTIQGSKHGFDRNMR